MINEEFYDLVYRLEYLIRYSNVPRIHDESMDPSTDPGPIPPPGFDPADAGEQWDEDY